MATIPAPGSLTAKRNFLYVTPHPLQNDEIHSLVQVSVVSPSWAWRHGVRALISERLPALSLTCHDDISPPVSVLPSRAHHAVVLDGAMVHAMILEWIDFWIQTSSSTRVLVLDAPRDAETLSSYFVAGIVGYTSLGDEGSAIIAALEDLQKGIVTCSPDLIASLMTASGPSQTVCPLSPREAEVLKLIARRLSNQQIAGALSVELSTVKHHVHNILHKLDVPHRWEAVSLATSEGWLDRS